VRYRDQLTTALFHSKATAHHIRKALDLLGCDADDDEPVEESGLIPPPPESDFAGPDYVPSTTPLDDDLANPQSRGGVYLLFDQLRRR
jgi:hypothetical protein